MHEASRHLWLIIKQWAAFLRKPHQHATSPACDAGTSLLQKTASRHMRRKGRRLLSNSSSRMQQLLVRTQGARREWTLPGAHLEPRGVSCRSGCSVQPAASGARCGAACDSVGCKTCTLQWLVTRGRLLSLVVIGPGKLMSSQAAVCYKTCRWQRLELLGLNGACWGSLGCPKVQAGVVSGSGC